MVKAVFSLGTSLRDDNSSTLWRRNFTSLTLMIILQGPSEIAYVGSIIQSSIVCDNVHHCRTVSSIILNCISTMFLCTWVAFHPDVPTDIADSSWRKLLLRMRFMFVALLAPEYMLWTSLLEWMDACEDYVRIKQKFPRCHLTEMHFMFGRMGGFQVVRERGKVPLRDVQFFTMLFNSEIEVPTITESELRDRSKSDNVAKAIVLVQTLWFAIQAATRASQGLTVTEFELSTLGHVVLNFCISWCWWNKPLNVNYPVDVYPRDALFRATSKDTLEHDLEPRLTLPIRIRIGAYLYAAIAAQLGRSGSWQSWRAWLIVLWFYIIGGILGAIHCLAWNASFPTSVQQNLWRASAVIITFIPGLIFALFGHAHKQLNIVLSETIKSPVVAPILLVYCFARVCLLVLALISLRALPYDAFIFPSWTRYIPHIG